MNKNETYIGELTERVTIQSYVESKSEVTGATSSTWQVLKNCWAKVEDVSGSEEIEGRIVYVNTKLFVLRYDARLVGPGATTGKQILFEGEEYNIVSVSNIGTKRYLKLKAFKVD
jgi:SPP1 family predicted phage head-tail adaptor